MCRKKQKLIIKLRKARGLHGQDLRSIKKTLNKELSQSRNQYMSEFLVQSINQNPKSFWSHIKKVRSDEVGVADVEVNSSMVYEERAKAEALN